MDVSPISIRNVLNSHNLPGSLSLLHTYGVKRFSTLARLHGAGFKVLSRLNHTLSPRYRRLKAVWDRVGMPFELWLGRGLPLDPYLRGYLFDILLLKKDK